MLNKPNNKVTDAAVDDLSHADLQGLVERLVYELKHVIDPVRNEPWYDTTDNGHGGAPENAALNAGMKAMWALLGISECKFDSSLSKDVYTFSNKAPKSLAALGDLFSTDRVTQAFNTAVESFEKYEKERGQRVLAEKKGPAIQALVATAQQFVTEHNKGASAAGLY